MNGKFIKLVLTTTVMLTTEGWNSKIQYGTVGDITMFPYVGSFQIPQFLEDRRHICTTVLVNKMIAITAGHCLVLDKEKPLKPIPLTMYKAFVIMGVANYTDETNPGFQKSQVSRIHLHKRIDLGRNSRVSSFFDIGALQLATEMKMSPTVGVIQEIPREMTPRLVMVEMIQRKRRCDLAGWGALEVSYKVPKVLTFPKVLQVTKFILLSKKACCDIIYPTDTRSECLQTLGRSSGMNCHVKYVLNASASTGDSGAPIVCFMPSTGERYVVGIHVGGVKSRGPYLQGPVEVFNPSFRIMQTVMRRYISIIKKVSMMSGADVIGVLAKLVLLPMVMLLVQ